MKSLPEFIPNYESLNVRVETNRASLKLSSFQLPPLGTGGETSSQGSVSSERDSGKYSRSKSRLNSSDSDLSNVSSLGVIR